MLGIALVLTFAVWVGVVAGRGDGRPGPVLLLIAGMVFAVAVGRVLSRRPGSAHRGVAIAVAGTIAITWPGLLQAGGAPTGYANANATLSSLGVLGAIGAAWHSGQPKDRRVWFGVGGVLFLATFLSGSVAGTVSLLGAVALVGASEVTRRPRLAFVAGFVAVAMVVAVTSLVAFGVNPAGIGGPADVRAELWVQAADLAEEAPLWGVGPGEFAERSRVSTDADLRWAHHGYLQAAAEYGVVGLLLVLALIGCGCACVWHVSRAGRRDTVLAGAALTIVSLHAAVDHIWHVPAVMLLLGLLLGAGTSPRADALMNRQMVDGSA